MLNRTANSPYLQSARGVDQFRRTDSEDFFGDRSWSFIIEVFALSSKQPHPGKQDLWRPLGNPDSGRPGSAVTWQPASREATPMEAGPWQPHFREARCIACAFAQRPLLYWTPLWILRSGLLPRYPSLSRSLRLPPWLQRTTLAITVIRVPLLSEDRAAVLCNQTMCCTYGRVRRC